jgi:uncharacterized membrane protein YfcA
MTAGVLAGGWFGAHYAQKADPRKVRGPLVHAIGLTMSAYFFIPRDKPSSGFPDFTSAAM